MTICQCANVPMRRSLRAVIAGYDPQRNARQSEVAQNVCYAPAVRNSLNIRHLPPPPM
jgi:hypothetical protein